MTRPRKTTEAAPAQDSDSPSGAADPDTGSGFWRLERLKKRSDFLRVAGQRRKWATPGLVLQAAPRPRHLPPSPAIRVGFTTSKKVGGAVDRNRARRRLRALATALLPQEGRPGWDYVLIGRKATVQRPYDLLLADLKTALGRLRNRR